MTPGTGAYLNHIKHTGERGSGFVWKFLGLYVLIMGLFQLASYALMGDIYIVYAEFVADLISGGDPDLEAFEQRLNENQLTSTLVSLVSYPLIFAIWVFGEAALQRRYMRDEPFSLKWSRDEGHMAIIALIWVGFMIALYIALIVFTVIGVILVVPVAMASPVAAGIIGGLLLIAYMVFSLYFLTRFCAISALTIRDKTIRFNEAWTISRGRWGKPFWALIVLSLAYFLAILLIYGAGFGLAYAQIAPLAASGADTDELVSAILSGSVLGPLAILMLLQTIVTGFIWIIWAGVGALLAKTDPTWVGNPAVASDFD